MNQGTKAIFAELAKKTPKDSRILELIYFSKGIEQREKIISLNGKESSFEVAKKSLVKLLKGATEENKKTVGWYNGKVTVYVEKDYGISPKYLKDNPEEKQRYLECLQCTKRQKITKFIVKYQNGQGKQFFKYGELQDNPYFKSSNDEEEDMD